MIFKIQLPIVTNEPEPHALIYNEDRTIEFTAPIRDVEELFIENPYKIFVEATVVSGRLGSKSLKIKGLEEDQSW